MTVAGKIQTVAGESQAVAGKSQTEAGELQQTDLAFNEVWCKLLNSKHENILSCLDFDITDEVYPALRQHNVISANSYKILRAERNPVLRAQTLFNILERCTSEEAEKIIKIFKEHIGHQILTNELQDMYNKASNAQ